MKSVLLGSDESIPHDNTEASFQDDNNCYVSNLCIFLNFHYKITSNSDLSDSENSTPEHMSDSMWVNSYPHVSDMC